MRAGPVIEADDVANQVTHEGGSAPVDVGDRQSAALTVGQAAPGVRVDHFLIDHLGCRVVPIAVLAALREAAGFGRTVAVEDDRLDRAHVAQPPADIFTHGGRTGLAGDPAHAHAGEVGAHFGRADDHAPHKTGNAPQHRGVMPLDQAHRIVERAVHAEVAVRRAGKRAHHRCARRVGIGGRARKRAHRSLGQREQVGEDVAIVNPGDLRHAPRLQQVGVIVVGGDVQRCGLARAAGGVVDLPQCAFVQRQIRAIQAKRFRVRHQVFLGRERQAFEVVDAANRRRVDAGLGPTSAIVGVASGAQFDLARQQHALNAPDFLQRLAQKLRHRANAFSVSATKRRNNSAAGRMSRIEPAP